MPNFIDQIEKEIRRLSKERDVLSRRIKKLEDVRSEYAREGTHESPRPRVDAGAQGRAQKIIAILRGAGRPMHYKEIIEKLIQTGAEKFEGVNDKGATMTATLSLHKDIFKRVGKGTYALIESEEEYPKPDVPF